MRRITMLALAALLAITGAACGGDDDGDGDEATSDSGDDGSTNDGGDDGNADDVDLGLVDDDCEFLLAGAFLNPIGATQSGSDPDFEETAEQLGEIADDAPDEISDAMNVLAEGYAEIAEIFQDIDFSDPSTFQDPEVAEKLQELDEVADEEYQAAAQDVSDWMEENCTGIAGN